MKKNLLKTVLFISILIGMSYLSCKPDDFTEKDAMNLQSQLDQQRIRLQDSLNTANALLADSLDKNFEKVTYTLSLIDASKSTVLKGDSESKGGLSGATATMTQAGVIVTKTSSAAGLVMFNNLQKGLATLHVTLTGYSEINAVIDFTDLGIATSVNGGIEFGNVLPMIPLSGTSTGTIKGTVVCESDLTNKAPEPVPAGTKVIATVNTASSALSGIAGGIVLSISYDNLSLEALTDATGSFVMTVPGTSMGLDYNLRVSDFSVNQSLLMLTKGGLPVTGVQSVPTNFGSGFSSGSSTIPTVNAVLVSIGAPDYTFTAASATAVVTNTNGLDYIQTLNSGNFYYPGTTFSSVIIDNPAPGTGGTNAYLDFTTNNSGQVTSSAINTKGSGYATTVENSTFTLPYIKSSPRAVVLAVNGSGGITSWRVSIAGQFFSTSNIEFVRSTGSGTGAVLPLPTIFNSGSYLFFNTAVQTPSSPIGANFAVNDEFTLAIKSGLSDVMTGKIHMTTGSVTAINVINEGTNYISGKVDVVISSPGTSGTTATASATVSNGRIASISINNGGNNYSSIPTVTIVNKVEKVQALATPVINANGNITSLTLNAGGNGYLTVPSVTITPSIPSVGSGASALAVISGGSVTSLSLVNGGSGYVGVNFPTAVQNAPSSIPVSVKGSGTTITLINLGTGKRTIEL